MIYAANGKATWITRRIDRIEFIDRATVKREVTLDIDLNAYLSRTAGAGDTSVVAPVEHGLVHVPLAALPRAGHTTIDVTDESGALVPRLNMYEERRLMCAAVEHQAKAIISADLPTSTAELLADILHGRKSSGDLRADRINSPEAALAASPQLRAVLATLHERFNLVVLLPESGPPRRVIRYVYYEPPENKGEDVTGWWASAWARFKSASQSFLLPGRGLPVTFLVENAHEAMSYHFEFSAPYDLDVYNGVLAGTFNADLERRAYDDDDDALNRAHVFRDACPPGANGVFDCVLRPVSGGMVRSSAVSALAILGVLIAALAYVHSASAGHLASSPDRSSATAALLLAPGVLAAVLAVPSGHSMTTRLLAGTRINVAAACGVLFAAAFAFGFRFSKPNLLVTLWTTTIIAALLAFRLCAQYLVIIFKQRAAIAEINKRRRERRG